MRQSPLRSVAALRHLTTEKARLTALLLAVFAITLVVSGAAAVTPVTYRAEVMADNPVGYWRLGEAPLATVALDETVNNSRGAYKNGVTLGVPGGIPTDTDTGASFDGGNDRVEWVDSPTLDTGTGDFTM